LVFLRDSDGGDTPELRHLVNEITVNALREYDDGPLTPEQQRNQQNDVDFESLDHNLSNKLKYSSLNLSNLIYIVNIFCRS
jgi:hypothetical protein